MSGHLFTPGQMLSGETTDRRPRPSGREPKDEGILKTPSERKATVLFVDDEELIRRSTIRLLRDDGLVFREAGNGVAALELFEKADIDLVITDLRMPFMGGLELLRRVRETDGDARVIVASGNFSHEERAEVLAHGAIATLDKPYDIVTLREAISSALVNPRADAAKHARVLLVDDDPDCRDALAILLGAEGHLIQTAENGLDGLGSFFAGGFDVVVSDLHMPKMNGLEMLREILKGNPRAKVIMMSAEANHEELAALEAAGAFAVLGKPVDVPALLNVIGQAVSE